MTTPSETSKQTGSASPRSVVRRLLAGQETGLLLVILLMGALLTVRGGSKDKNVTLALGQDDSWSSREVNTADDQVRYDVEVDRGGTVTRYARSVRPRERERDGQRELIVSKPVNKFLDSNNLVLVAKDASFIAIMAVGMTAVIILAGIDLSVGSIYAYSAFVGAIALRAMGDDTGLLASVPVGLLVCCGVGALCGLANGVMIVGLRVHPFVITLGTMAAFRGILLVQSKSQSIGGFPDSFTSGFFKAEIAGTYPVPVIVMAVVAAAGVFVLSKTVVGRQVYAIGGNETAARYAGIPVGRVKIIVFTMLGLLCGLSAAVYLGYLGAADPNAGQAYELKVIAATVIGGASLMGGRGSALGAVLGAIIIQLIENGMIILDIDSTYNQIVMGIVIIAAVVIDQAKARLSPGG